MTDRATQNGPEEVPSRMSVARRGRRRFLEVAAAAPLLAAAGCFTPNAPQKGAVNGPSSGAEVPIEIWSGWTEGAATKIESILKDFNQSQTAVKAKHVVVPDNMSQKLLAAISASNPPAGAIVFGAGTAYQLAARNALFAIEDIAQPDELDEAKAWMTPGLWELGRYQDKTYFVPIWSQSWGVFVNTKLAKQAGVDPDSPPQTLEDLVDSFVAMTTFDKSGQIETLGGTINEPYVAVARYLGRLVSDDGRTITADDPGVVQGVSLIDGLWERLGRTQMQNFEASLQGRSDRSGFQDPFLAGLQASVLIGPWEFDTILSFAPKDFEYTVWPVPKPESVSEHGTYTYGDGFVFPSRAQEPEAAWQLARQLSGVSGDIDVYSSLFTSWQCVNSPTSDKVLESETFRTTVSDKCPGYEDVFMADISDADYFLYPPKIPTSEAYTSLFNAEFEKIRLGQLPVDEGLGKVGDSAQQALDQWHEQNQ